MKLAGLLRRERTTVATLATTTFNAPGIYYPPYGKTVIQLSGQGSPGNASTSGNYSGSNYYEYMTYVPASGGTYANTNPSTPGNVINSYIVGLRDIRMITYNTANQTVNQDVYFAGQVLYYFDSSQYAPVSPSTFSSYTFTPPSDYGYNNGYDYFSIISSNYNPSISGNPNYNPYYPAYTYYTGVPGNPNYNPTVAGNTAPSYNVIGISLPGGAADSAAPVIGFSTVSIDYSTAGTPVSVPPGGYVSIKNI